MKTHRISQFVSPIAWLLALVTILFILPTIPAQAQTSCHLYDVDGSNVRYVRFTNDFARGNVSWYNSSSCDTSGGSLRLPGSGVARSSSESGAQAICDANLSGRNTVARDTNAITSNFWVCANHSPKRSSRGRSEYVPPPYIPSGITLNQSDLRLSAVDGFHSGIQFQRVGHDGVGIPAVIALGLLDAVDVWGTIGGGYEVCFPQAGRIVFLDAATAPRTVSEIAHYTDGSFTCARGARAGTLVLARGDAPPEVADRAPDISGLIAPILYADHSEVVSLEGCQIITRYNMHHRTSPAGSSRGLVPGDTLLDSTERSAEWFRAAYEGRDGWLNVWFLAYFGDCGYPGGGPEEEEPTA